MGKKSILAITVVFEKGFLGPYFGSTLLWSQDLGEVKKGSLGGMSGSGGQNDQNKIHVT